ncbi:MAG: threonylcarbamoyl-AMP synthase [Parcubacteria group bacterium]|nr:threonylcarbamoyl-AMP synthase [Parcubacteria group bacterium]
MKIIKFNLPKNLDDLDNKIVEVAVGVIQRNGSIIYPTDTVYGLGVSALQEHNIERLFKLKKRPETKPVPVMVRDIEMAKKLAFINKGKEKILRAVWPGPVTVILEKRDIVPDILTANKRTIGLRIPDCLFTQALMENLEEPITATSANFSGEPPLSSSKEIIRVFSKAYPRPDLILDVGDLLENPPSTVLDLTGLKPKITRIGPVSKKELDKLFK